LQPAVSKQIPSITMIVKAAESLLFIYVPLWKNDKKN
jgi:hypothetical protein